MGTVAIDAQIYQYREVRGNTGLGCIYFHFRE